MSEYFSNYDELTKTRCTTNLQISFAFLTTLKYYKLQYGLRIKTEPSDSIIFSRLSR